MAANSLVTEAAVEALANAVNANKAGKSELTPIADMAAAAKAAVDAMPVLEPDTTNFAALIQAPVGGTAVAGLDPATKAKLDAMPALVVVSDPALIPAGTVGLVIP